MQANSVFARRYLTRPDPPNWLFFPKGRFAAINLEGHIITDAQADELARLHSHRLRLLQKTQLVTVIVMLFPAWGPMLGFEPFGPLIKLGMSPTHFIATMLIAWTLQFLLRAGP